MMRIGRSTLAAALALPMATAGSPAHAGEPEASSSGSLAHATPAPQDADALRDRVRELERRLDLLERKLRMLASDDAGLTDALEEPRFLYERAERIVAEASPLTVDASMEAYRYLALIHLLHPDHPLDAEAFPLASHLFTRIWYATRYKQADSVWQTSEPVFMFQWLAHRFVDDAVPQAAVDELLVGLPFGMFRRFQDFAATPQGLPRWRFRAEEDNGIVTAVLVEPAEE